MTALRLRRSALRYLCKSLKSLRHGVAPKCAKVYP